MRKVCFAALLFLAFTVLSSAQQQTPPAPPQSPRQALIEMLNGGQTALLKHLTVEVQQLLVQPENKQALMGLAMTSSLKSEMGQDVQIFESGPVLMSINDAKGHRKMEVQVTNDDLSGDQDTLDLSLHSFHDGQEEAEEWQSFLSNFTVILVRQQEIWRLSKIVVGVQLAIGDPEFLKQTYLRSASGVGMVGGRIGPEVHTDVTTGETVRPEMTPSQLLLMVGFAEQTFARQHADVGFTCSLADLVDADNRYGLDTQIANGSYKGYKITLSGCQGKPAGSFQLAFEPMPGQGGKAYCTDATHNVRESDDGRATTCFAAGRPEHSTAYTSYTVDSVGVGLASQGSAKPKE